MRASEAAISGPCCLYEGRENRLPKPGTRSQPTCRPVLDYSRISHHEAFGTLARSCPTHAMSMSTDSRRDECSRRSPALLHRRAPCISLFPLLGHPQHKYILTFARWMSFRDRTFHVFPSAIVRDYTSIPRSIQTCFKDNRHVSSRIIRTRRVEKKRSTSRQLPDIARPLYCFSAPIQRSRFARPHNYLLREKAASCLRRRGIEAGESTRGAGEVSHHARPRHVRSASCSEPTVFSCRVFFAIAAWMKAVCMCVCVGLGEKKRASGFPVFIQGTYRGFSPARTADGPPSVTHTQPLPPGDLPTGNSLAAGFFFLSTAERSFGRLWWWYNNPTATLRTVQSQQVYVQSGSGRIPCFSIRRVRVCARLE